MFFLIFCLIRMDSWIFKSSCYLQKTSFCFLRFSLEVNYIFSSLNNIFQILSRVTNSTKYHRLCLVALTANILNTLLSIVIQCQVQFALEGESPWSWLRYAYSVETSCNELGDMDLSEQPWPQLMCCVSYKPYGHNFREWSCKKL